MPFICVKLLFLVGIGVFLKFRATGICAKKLFSAISRLSLLEAKVVQRRQEISIIANFVLLLNLRNTSCHLAIFKGLVHEVDGINLLGVHNFCINLCGLNLGVPK